MSTPAVAVCRRKTGGMLAFMCTVSSWQTNMELGVPGGALSGGLDANLLHDFAKFMTSLPMGWRVSATNLRLRGGGRLEPPTSDNFSSPLSVPTKYNNILNITIYHYLLNPFSITIII